MIEEYSEKINVDLFITGVLAGEFFLPGALAAQHLARAHQQLGRG